MRGFYEYIKEKINTDLPKYKTVELFNSQNTQLLDKQIEVVVFPAVFVDFDFIETRQLALGIKDMDLIVRFRFMFENYTYGSRLNDLDLMTEFTGFFDLWKGEETDSYQFTQFQEVIRGLDKDYDMVNFPFIDYRTTYKNQENYTRSGQTVVSPVSLDVSGEILD